MATNDRLRDRYPIFNAFGGKHDFLGNDEAAATTMEERIKSIWPFIVSRVREFSKTLKPRERVNFDPEDVLTELWVILAEKDCKWTPERGKYITYAGVIIDRELLAIRDKARTVHAPRNSSCRMKAYRAEEAAGTLTEQRRRTAEDIRRTDKVAGLVGSRGAEDGEGCSFEPIITDDPLVSLVTRERADGMRSGLKAALECLRPFDAQVINRTAGLDGAEAVSVKELASAVGRTEVEVRRAKDRGMIKIRAYLAATKHPVFNEHN